MSRANLLQEKRKMMFEEVYSVWTERRLTQEEAGQLLGDLPADVPALGGPLRGARDRRSAGQAAVAGVAPGGAGGRGDADGGPATGRVTRAGTCGTSTPGTAAMAGGAATAG